MRKWGDGFYIGVSGSDVSLPSEYTGRLKREGGFWYCEYYWMGERKWWGIGSTDKTEATPKDRIPSSENKY
jgi:hypothetical protein